MRFLFHHRARARSVATFIRAGVACTALLLGACGVLPYRSTGESYYQPPPSSTSSSTSTTPPSATPGYRYRHYYTPRFVPYRGYHRHPPPRSRHRRR